MRRSRAVPAGLGLASPPVGPALAGSVTHWLRLPAVLRGVRASEVDVKVLKFGGSSVADRGQIERVLAIVARLAKDDRLAVVCSAHKGVTDALVQTARR